MSDLSWLNPTPHAIAVYASQPPSPVATQHSLPSRTLPFTWAGLSPAGSHQLCLAHSFDYLIGEREQLGRNLEAERLRGLEVDDQLEPGRLIDRQVGRLLAFENPRGIHADPAISIHQAVPVAHEATSPGHLTIDIDGRHCVLFRERHDLLAPIGQK